MSNKKLSLGTALVAFAFSLPAMAQAQGAQPSAPSLPPAATPVVAAPSAAPPPSGAPSLPMSRTAEVPVRDMSADVADARAAQARVSDAVRACAATPADDKEKLRCFNAVASHLTMGAADPSAPTLVARVDTGGWIATDDGAMHMVALGAYTLISDGEPSSIKASLFVRCQDAKTDSFVTFSEKVAGKDAARFDVTLKFDDSPSAVDAMVPSVSGVSLGHWGDDDAINLAKHVMSAQHMRVRVEMPDDRDLSAMFDLKGAEAAMSRVRSACKW